MKSTTGSVAGIRVLHKAVDVLEALRGEASGMALSDLAKSVGMPKPTVYRIVATLKSRGYVEDGSAGAYRISRKLLQPLPEESPVQNLLRAARPAIVALVASCQETCNLGVLDGGEVLVIETTESPLSVRMSSKIGNRRYAHSTALGKVLLAGLTHTEVLRTIRSKGMPHFTTSTITGEEQLLVHLERVRQQGFALDNRENELHGRCIAAPILSRDRQVVAALSISGPLPRMTVKRAKSLLPDLWTACQSISDAIIRRL
jgi:IclR family transcriptional regulator, KDG regulon repressor